VQPSGKLDEKPGAPTFVQTADEANPHSAARGLSRRREVIHWFSSIVRYNNRDASGNQTASGVLLAKCVGDDYKLYEASASQHPLEEPTLYRAGWRPMRLVDDAASGGRSNDRTQ